MAGAQILVVEDNEKNMKLFRDVLEATGYGMLEAASGERRGRARDRARTRSGADGHPATGHRRRRGAPPAARGRAHGAIPVVALTAQAMQGDRERFLAAGFDGYVSKPVGVAALVETVQQHVGGG